MEEGKFIDRGVKIRGGLCASSIIIRIHEEVRGLMVFISFINLPVGLCCYCHREEGIGYVNQSLVSFRDSSREVFRELHI